MSKSELDKQLQDIIRRSKERPDHDLPEVRSEVYVLPDGRKIQIGKYDLDLLYKLRQLPASIRIKILRLSEEEMELHISESKKSDIAFLKEILSKKWRWRETGDIAEGDYEIPPELTPLNLSVAQTQKKLKAKKIPFTIKEIRATINFFVGDNSELYTE